MHFVRSLFLAAALGLAAMGAAADDSITTPPLPDRVDVPKMRTSIYVGSVSLTTSQFQRHGSTVEATYEAKVFPWAFWNEHGDIRLNVPESDLSRLVQGETIEITGEATSHKNKPRRVTGRVHPASGADGAIKVRIEVDGIELVFNGTYRLPTP